jgi:hypothetical protein
MDVTFTFQDIVAAKPLTVGQRVSFGGTKGPVADTVAVIS